MLRVLSNTLWLSKHSAGVNITRLRSSIFISGNIFKASDHQIFNMITYVSLISPIAFQVRSVYGCSRVGEDCGVLAVEATQ